MWLCVMILGVYSVPRVIYSTKHSANNLIVILAFMLDNLLKTVYNSTESTLCPNFSLLNDCHYITTTPLQIILRPSANEFKF